jgi:hypothetical protein
MYINLKDQSMQTLNQCKVHLMENVFLFSKLHMQEELVVDACQGTSKTPLDQLPVHCVMVSPENIQNKENLNVSI